MAKDSAGWHWCLWSGNGRMIARNAEPYADKKHALQAVRIVQQVAPAVRLVTEAKEK